jgi:hypothetical protein
MDTSSICDGEFVAIDLDALLECVVGIGENCVGVEKPK